MRILVATDAWHPQVNGVVRTLDSLAREAPAFGAEVSFLTPEGFRTIPLPSYPEIRLSLASPDAIARRVAEAAPDAIHVATEGTLGVMVRRHCLLRGLPFTTCYHTRYPQYLSARLPVPEDWTYALLRRFHNAGAGTMVATEALEKELAGAGFRRLMRWSRGVDTALFRPRPDMKARDGGPVFICVARLAVEKNLDAFLALDLPGRKVVVGDGPARRALETRYPDTTFLGLLEGEDLARAYAAADVFVFPSRTETFGLVLLEAIASGLPVAAFPVAGLLPDLEAAGCAALSEDLRAAALAALSLDPSACVSKAREFSHAASARAFVDNVRDANDIRPGRPGRLRRLLAAAA